MDAPCFTKDRINIGVKGVGTPRTTSLLEKKKLNKKSPSSKSKLSDTKPEDDDQLAVGPSFILKRRLLSATPARLLAPPDVRLGDLGSGFRSLRSLQSTLIDLAQDEKQRGPWRFDKSGITDYQKLHARVVLVFVDVDPPPLAGFERLGQSQE
ncbi:hypothetical protein FRB90_004837, partial [Tulasnella sp. 427]